MKKTYPVRLWLQLLEPEVRKMAMANLDNPDCGHVHHTKQEQTASLYAAIDRHAYWVKTPQGWDFWARERAKAARDTRTPEEFLGVDCTVPL
jgi:hypothetical protein